MTKWQQDLVVENVWVAETVARKIANRMPPHADVEYDDLCSAGMFGLLRAIERYDPSRNVKFSTFSQLHVYGAIIDFMRKQDTVSRITRLRATTWYQAEESFRKKYGFSPTEDEMRKILGVSDKMFDSMKKSREMTAEMSGGKSYVEVAAKNAASRGSGDSSENDACHSDQMEREGTHIPAPDERMIEKETWAQLTKGLSQFQRLVVTLYFKEGMEMLKIGKSLGYSESRISQIISESIKILRTTVPPDTV